MQMRQSSAPEVERRFLVDVAMEDLPFPIVVPSRKSTNGQRTVATVSVNARIMHDFEAQWIDTFIQILHSHRNSIGYHSLRKNIEDYRQKLRAKSVEIDFSYPYFMEKRTPIDQEPCLVRYACRYRAKVPSLENDAQVAFQIDVPAITSYPVRDEDDPRGSFGQMSIFSIEVRSQQDVVPEDIVELVDRHALAPLYSYLSAEEQKQLIHDIHNRRVPSVVAVDEIKKSLAHSSWVDWYSVTCRNHGMLHSYKTVIDTEKSMWVPFSGYEQEI
jgi:GTP cyclohydrolase I